MGDSSRHGAHRPFAQLGRLLRDARVRLQPRGCGARLDSLPTAEDVTDEELFEKAMQGVIPAVWSHDPAPSSPPPPLPEACAAFEDLRLMQEALEGPPTPVIADHPEYIEGWVDVHGKLLLPRLRRGLYSIQGQIDLHGLTRSEARGTVEEFIRNMSRFRSCCVKIIHGRGINSPDDTAVLKDNLQRWLITRRLSRYVVAYASAPVKDGGVGAVYVLLKRSGPHPDPKGTKTRRVSKRSRSDPPA